MSTGAIIFMTFAWGTIIGGAVIFLAQLLKHSKQ
jgi:hypothetical protein